MRLSRRGPPLSYPLWREQSRAAAVLIALSPPLRLRSAAATAV